MTGFTKLFSSIVNSTIWDEDAATRLVWITLLCLSDANGNVEGSIPGLAHQARVSLDETRKALKKLMAPDPDSRSKEHDGRRIEEIDGGWLILNYTKYRKKLSADARREYQAKWIADKRAEAKAAESSLLERTKAQLEEK